MKTLIRHLIEGARFNHFITALILFNALLVGLETYPQIQRDYGSFIYVIDLIILGLFTLEIVLKLFVYRMNFFKNGWNNFDFIIVFGSLILYTSSFISVLRIFRVLRILRTITTIPSLRRIVSALFMAIPTISSVMLLMSIIFYVYAVIGTMFYAGIEPEYFGNLGLSFITLFQIFTLESWASGIFRPIFAEEPWSWFYFVSFIVAATFIVVNLIVGEIVNNAQNITKEIESETKDIKEDTNEIQHLKNEVSELKSMLQTLINRK